MAIETARRYELLYQGMFSVQAYTAKNNLSPTGITEVDRIKRAQEDNVVAVVYREWAWFG